MYQTSTLETGEVIKSENTATRVSTGSDSSSSMIVTEIAKRNRTSKNECARDRAVFRSKKAVHALLCPVIKKRRQKNIKRIDEILRTSLLFKAAENQSNTKLVTLQKR